MEKEEGKKYIANGKSNLRLRTYSLGLKIVQFVGSLQNDPIFWVFRDQLLKSGTSIGANVIEAQTASSRREFYRYYSIALKSANETKYWLSLLRDAGLVNITKINEVLDETVQISNMLAASLITIRNKARYF